MTKNIKLDDIVQVTKGRYYGTIGRVVYFRSELSDRKEPKAYATIRRRTDGECIEVNAYWLEPLPEEFIKGGS